MPPSLTALLRAPRRDKDKELADLVTLTLTKMAEGGIYDQLGGGFHRYSTERTWTVPALREDALRQRPARRALRRGLPHDPKPLYKRVVDETLEFVLREMTSPRGGVLLRPGRRQRGQGGRVLRLDRRGDREGTRRQGRRAWSSGPPTASPGRRPSRRRPTSSRSRRPLAEVAKDQKLTEERTASEAGRPQAEAACRSARSGNAAVPRHEGADRLERPDDRRPRGRRADVQGAGVHEDRGEGRRLRARQPADQGRPAAAHLRRKADGKPEAKLNAYLDDYAYLVHGLLCLHDATGEARWLNEAKALTDTMVKWHGDGGPGRVLLHLDRSREAVRPAKDQYDGVQPSGNSVAARNLVRLWQKTGDDTYRKLAEKTFKQFAGVLKAIPPGGARDGRGPAPVHSTWPGKSPTSKSDPKKESDGKARNSADVVSATATLGAPDKDGQRAVTVTLKIEKPWHIYANPVGARRPGRRADDHRRLRRRQEAARRRSTTRRARPRRT